MATILLDPGSAAANELTQFWGALGFTGTSDAQAVQGSVRSIKCTTGQYFIGAYLADAGRRASFYIRFSALPSSGNAGIFDIDDGTLTAVVAFSLRITSTGKLAIYNNAGTLVATGATTLAINTDYRISLAYTITSTTVNSFTVYLNGVSEVTATNMATSTGYTTLVFSMGADFLGGGSPIAYFAHIYIDSLTTGDPGDVRVTAKRPNANGTTNGFTTQIGAGGSGYGTGHSQQVNERINSDTNGWSMVGAGAAVTEEFNIEGVSVGDANLTRATIVDFVGWVRAKSLASETASIVLAGVSSNIALTSTITWFSKVAGSTTYPAGGTDIGIITATTLTTVSLYECGIIVAYIPAPIVSMGEAGLPPRITPAIAPAAPQNLVAIHAVAATAPRVTPDMPPPPRITPAIGPLNFVQFPAQAASAPFVASAWPLPPRGALPVPTSDQQNAAALYAASQPFVAADMPLPPRARPPAPASDPQSQTALYDASRPFSADTVAYRPPLNSAPGLLGFAQSLTAILSQVAVGKVIGGVMSHFLGPKDILAAAEDVPLSPKRPSLDNEYDAPLSPKGPPGRTL